MKLHAEGRARFHFWGTYAQSFFLLFATAEDAALALPVLQQLALTERGTGPDGSPIASKGWINSGASCGVIASGADVERIEAQLVAFGADAKAIGSLEHSVDRGDMFQVTIEVQDPAQILMFI